MSAAPRARPRGAVRALRWAGALFAAFMLLLVLGLATAWWALRTDDGTARLLTLLPRFGIDIQVEAPQGTLLGDFNARHVRIRLAGGHRIEIDDWSSRGLRIQRGAGAAYLHVTIDELRARKVDVSIASSESNEPLNPPSSLQSPVTLELRALRVGELFVSSLGEQPMRDLQARLRLGLEQQHRIEALRTGWDRLQLEGHAQIASTAPFTLDVQLQARQDTARPDPARLPSWSAQASLQGPLAAPTLQATLRAAALPGRDAQSLDARATVHPFAAWPLGELQATLQAVDLSAFNNAAPASSLSGEASATSTGLNQPASVKLALRNALAGRVDESRLPLRSIDVELAAVPSDPNTLELKTFDAELGTQARAAGRVSGAGRWTRERWNLSAALADLQPALLDSRAPVMKLGGPLELVGSGHENGFMQSTIAIEADLRGQFAERGPARSARLQLDGSVNTNRIELRRAEASAGNARATLSGLARRDTTADAPWSVTAKAALLDFDPAPWWPGAKGSPLLRAPNRVNAAAQLELHLPAGAPPATAIAWLRALRGRVDATVADTSVLAGVPLAGELHLKNTDGALLAASIVANAAGNTLHADGRLATRGGGVNEGASDAWTLKLDAPALDKLAPLAKLLQLGGPADTLAGRLSASAQVTGRWPTLTTQGQLDASGLRVSTFGAERAQGRWQLGTAGDAPLDVQMSLTRLTLGAAAGPAPTVESAVWQMKGTARAHTMDLSAESKSLPPQWTESLQASAAAPAAAASEPARTVVILQAHGGLYAASAATAARDATPVGWRGAIDRAELNSSGRAPLLRTRDVQFDVAWSDGPARAIVQPGRADILGGALKWGRIAWQAASTPGGPAQIDADAEIEPLRVAPLLARAQPDFGWGGDLTLGGTLSIHSAPAFRADIVIERRSGDLSVTEELGTQALGLTDLRFGLSASDGVWSFTQALAGKAVGVAAGAIVARTNAQSTWPDATTPIEGVLELQVASLGTWGPWVPPGWRLDGALHATASIGGRFGAPEYTGRVVGTQITVRNFLQGVNISDGDVAISLQGTRARIERFNAKAGTGTLKLEGDAELGESPKAQLQLVAEKFQLLGRVDRRIVASGQARLELDKTTLSLNGKFDVDEGLIDFTRSDAPTLGDDVQVLRPRNAPSPAAAASAAASPAAGTVVDAPASREVALDLRVGLGEKLRLRGRGLNTGLRGELRITSPGGKLAVNGSVRAVDGTYAAYGQKLEIDRGVITFSGAIDNPRLDIEATRPNLDVRVGVAINGPALNPRVRLFSEPELPEVDKLSWLVLGRASDGLGRNDTALLQGAAMALLAGEDNDNPANQLTKAIGLDEISFKQSDGEVRETVVSLGKQLSRRWYVGYERSLNATAGNWQLIYRIAQRFTLRMQSGLDNSLDLIWTWRWQ